MSIKKTWTCKRHFLPPNRNVSELLRAHRFSRSSAEWTDRFHPSSRNPRLLMYSGLSFPDLTVNSEETVTITTDPESEIGKLAFLRPKTPRGLKVLSGVDESSVPLNNNSVFELIENPTDEVRLDRIGDREPDDESDVSEAAVIKAMIRSIPSDREEVPETVTIKEYEAFDPDDYPQRLRLRERNRVREQEVRVPKQLATLRVVLPIVLLHDIVVEENGTLLISPDTHSLLAYNFVMKEDALVRQESSHLLLTVLEEMK